jgi:protein-S-isoprenylcysteine O-methyltransferase Ste14
MSAAANAQPEALRHADAAPGGRRRMALATRAWLGLAAVVVAMGLVLFASAGRLRYWQAWVYLAVFTAMSTFTTLDLLKRDAALLERRLRAGPTAERRGAQKLIMLCTSIGFIALLVVPALDVRWGWSSMTPGVVVLGDALVAIGFGGIFLVYRANTYTSATIEVAEGQTVISTGPYAIVRHPMYASGLLYFAGTPLALGSCWGLLVVAVVMPFLIWRLLDEERFLAGNLQGYTEYQMRVRYRLVPFVW